jgi:hypothetical protein
MHTGLLLLLTVCLPSYGTGQLTPCCDAQCPPVRDIPATVTVHSWHVSLVQGSGVLSWQFHRAGLVT